MRLISIFKILHVVSKSKPFMLRQELVRLWDVLSSYYLPTEPTKTYNIFFCSSFLEQTSFIFFYFNLHFTVKLYSSGLRVQALSFPHYFGNNDDTAWILIPLKGLKAAAWLWTPQCNCSNLPIRNIALEVAIHWWPNTQNRHMQICYMTSVARQMKNNTVLPAKVCLYGLLVGCRYRW